MTYEATATYGNINPYEDKKANCQVSDYKAWLSLMGILAIIRMSAFKNLQILVQSKFKIFHLHINNQTPWNVL